MRLRAAGIQLAVVVIVAGGIAAFYRPERADQGPRPSVGVQAKATVASAASSTRPAPPTASAAASAAASFSRQLALATKQPTVNTPSAPGLDPRLASSANANGTTNVNVRGASAAVRQAVAAVGGTLLADVGNVASAVVPTRNLTELARASGVTALTKPVKAFADATSQAVAASGAAAWQSAYYTGTGITVGVVDAGFQGLTAQIALGNLPLGTSVAGNYCGSGLNASNHGTAVAEEVHQIAPGATLALYCVTDTVSFQEAEQQALATGIKIVNASVSFPGDDRGDGTGGGPTSAAATVQAARQAGILWIESAGNEGIDHWGGNFSYDAGTGLTQLGSNGAELDYIDVDKGQTAEVDLQWDNWPSSVLGVALAVAPSDSTGNPIGAFRSQPQSPGNSPVLSICFEPNPAPTDGCVDTANFTGTSQRYAVGVQVPATVPALRFDLTYLGAVSPNALSCSVPEVNGTCQTYTPSAGSIAQPASSPYAFAVGAVDASGSNACGGDVAGPYSYPVENYSSEGPTIDGRIKPDIAGFDGTATNVNPANAFCGTSASAPDVAGAAALVAQAIPGMNADALQNFLVQRANPGQPASAPSDSVGAGVLALSPAPPRAPQTPGTYVAISPARVLDTRLGNGGTILSANGTVRLQVGGRGGVPLTGVSAVVLNVTVTQPVAPGYMTVWADGVAMPGTSNLNFLANQSVPNLVVAPVSASGMVDLFNGSLGTAQLVADVSGYYLSGAYAPNVPGALVAISPARVLDTRLGNGGTILSANGTVRLQVGGRGGVPLTGVSAVVLNVTVTQPVAPGYMTVWADGVAMPGTSNLNFLANQSVPNLVVAPVSASGMVDLFNGSLGTAQLVADVSGYYLSGAYAPNVPGALVAISPARVLDTRLGNGGTILSANGTVRLQVGGRGGVPLTGVSAVVLNVTVTQPVAPGYITVWADGVAMPGTSNLNFLANQSVPNLVVAPVSASGMVDLFNGSLGTAQLVADVSAYVIG